MDQTSSFKAANRGVSTPAKSRWFGLVERLFKILGVLLVIAGIIAVDHIKGPIFPSDFYCLVGAGSEMIIPGRTEPDSWIAGGTCGDRRPECVNSWKNTPAYRVCQHGTLLDGIASAYPDLFMKLLSETPEETFLTRFEKTRKDGTTAPEKRANPFHFD